MLDNQISSADRFQAERHLEAEEIEKPRNSLAPEEHTEEHSTEKWYPEGGPEAWGVVFGSWCALVGAMGILNTLGTFEAYISTHQLADYNEGTIGWIFSLYTFMAWFGGIFIGPLFDKYGPRWLILSGSICVVGNMMLLGECSGILLQFLVKTFHKLTIR